MCVCVWNDGDGDGDDERGERRNTRLFMEYGCVRVARREYELGEAVFRVSLQLI